MATGYAAKQRERAEQLARLKARPGRRRGADSLSAVIAQQPASFDGRKIAAVDKNIASLDALPERYAGVKTLYVSKNALRSLAGIEQFRELKALSAADNELADLDCLRLLPAASIALEAASFEGNPIADLPNYRAHVIHILGPSLATLDNRTVTAEERAAAAGAVAHEATMLALMVSNACLVHKLGRAVQLVKLHCELQCAVLGGQYGTAAAAGAAAGVDGAGRCIGRVLQLWDYEGSLGQQERHAIGLAIRREVGRRYRKIVLAGGKPEGSSKLWQQAFAQVMLLQQETIASLMRMLEEAKAEAAASLAPITRPASPMKRRALESEQEAQGRVRQDREALIQELQDACLGLADASAHSNVEQRSAQFEARIRELHAALEAAGGSNPSSQQQLLAQATSARGGGEGEWAIPAVRPGATELAAPAAAQQQPAAAGRLKSALKQQRPSSSGGLSSRGAWSPAGPSPRRRAVQSGSDRQPGIERPSTGLGSGGHQQGRHWQADDGLAEYEDGIEQARCQTPRPFHAGAGQQHTAASLAATPMAEGGRPSVLSGAVQQQSCSPHSPSTARPPSATVRPGPRGSSPQRSQPSSAARQGSPVPQWTPNPLANQGSDSNGCTSPSAESPSQSAGIKGIFRLLEREGRVNQVEALKVAIGQYETAVAELQGANHGLNEALQAAQQRTQRVEAQLSEQQRAAQAAQEEAAAAAQRRVQQLEELGQRLEDVLASRVALQAQLEAGVAERQQLVEQARLEREAAAMQGQQLAEQLRQEQAAAAAQAQQLLAHVAELEDRKPVSLSLTVSHEAEWRAEAARTAALEASVAELRRQLADRQRQDRLEAACSQLAARASVRRAVLWWQHAAAEHADLRAAQQAADAHRRTVLLATWLSNWRAAVQRCRLLAAREQQRQQRRLQTAWLAWQWFRQECEMARGLQAAAILHRSIALQRGCFAAWRQRVQSCQQVELPPQHPSMVLAAQLQRRRLLASFFGAWRLYIQQTVLPRMARVQIAMLEQFMGSQRRAFLAWQQYLQHRRQQRALQEAARQHFMRVLLRSWHHLAADFKEERADMLRGILSSDFLLLRRCWRAWRLAVQEEQQEAASAALADGHYRRKLLAACWQCWGKWTVVCRGMGERCAVRLAATALRAWRHAARSAEKRRSAEAFHQLCCQRRSRATLRASLCAWRGAAAAKRHRRNQQAHAAGRLRRRLLGRVVAGWRRAALAGKLCHTLEVVHQLQGMVERVRAELQHKAEQVDVLQMVRVSVEGQSESLGLQVRSLDADLAAAQQQAADLQQAAHAAEGERSAAVAALQLALADKAALEAAAAAAAAGKEQAEAERAAASSAREAAEQRAAEAAARAEAARVSAVAATAQAEAAAKALEALTKEHRAVQAQLSQLQEERARLVAELEAARADVQRTAAELAALQKERDALQQQQEAAEQGRQAAEQGREAAEQGRLASELEQQAALKQAQRLAHLCEEQEQQCRKLQHKVGQLQSAMASQVAQQEELAQLTERHRQLLTDNQSMQGQLDRFAAAMSQAEDERAGLQQAAEELRKQQQELRVQGAEAEAEARRLAQLAGSLQAAKATLEQQLAESQAESSLAASERAELAAAVEQLRSERDGQAEAAQQLAEEKAGLEAAVARLKDQLQQSNGVLEACRQMLGECCSVRSAADERAAASLQEMLRAVKAELLLKDASIKALQRENERRAERLRALQAQVEALSAQVAAQGRTAAFEQGVWLGTAASAVAAPGVAAAATPTAALPSSADWASSYGARCKPAATAPAAAARPGSAGPAQRPTATYGGGAACSSPRPYAAAAVSSLSTAGLAPAAQQQQQGPSAAVQRQWQFTPASQAALSPPPSYISLQSQQQAWQQRMHAAGARSPPGTGASSSGSLAPAGSPPAPTGTSLQSGLAPTAGSLLAQALLPRQPLGCGNGGGTAAADVGPAGPAALPPQLAPELSEERLSFLLELVVARRITAAQAQQVINLAADGDAQPLLHLLLAVQQRPGEPQSTSSSAIAAAAPAAGIGSPSTPAS